MTSVPPTVAGAAATPATTLPEWLRERTDRELAALLRRRPDLGVPLPPDLNALAGRLGVRASVQRAVDGLNAFVLRVLEGLLLAADADGEVDTAEAVEWLAGVDEQAGADAIAELSDLGLAWGAPGPLRLVRAVKDAIGPYPAGLGRPAEVLLTLSPYTRHRLPLVEFTDQTRLAARLAACDDAEREVLDRLAAGPPVGAVRRALLDPVEGEPTPPQRLIARGLLIPIDAGTVELAREVGIALRSRPLGEVTPAPPTFDLVRRDPGDLDRLGATAVLEMLRLVDALADAWAQQPPPLLRSGGVGVRELRRTARLLGLDEEAAALVAEVTYAAGLVNSTNGVDPVFLPTPEYDRWRNREPAARWITLAGAWLTMTRQPTLVNQRSERDRLITVLGPDVERGTGPVLRRQVLDALTALPPGAAPPDRDAVLAQVAWQAPRRAGGHRPLAEAALVEADRIGLTAAGGPTGYGRTLLAGAPAAAEHALAAALPAPVEEFMVQPDLTVIVPGPPTPDLAAELGLLAELESTGGANVYRITEATVRRAFDGGRAGPALLEFLTERSRTPVPQALTYLIEDAARRHGVLRAGVAAAYLRSDDTALLTRVISDRSLDSLGLRLIAPTVLISTEPVSRVLEVLRGAGYAPAAEGGGGEVITLSRELPRAPSRPPARPVRLAPPVDSDGHVGELVRRLRNGDELAATARRVAPVASQVPGVTSAATMEMLRKAVREERSVLIGYAEPDGSTEQHTLRPISLAGGVVRGYEEGRSGLVGYPVHRLTAVILASDADDE
jgi:hypothetical protein